VLAQPEHVLRLDELRGLLHQLAVIHITAPPRSGAAEIACARGTARSDVLVERLIL